jgi:hypothetical protein
MLNEDPQILDALIALANANAEAWSNMKRVLESEERAG